MATLAVSKQLGDSEVMSDVVVMKLAHLDRRSITMSMES